MKRKYIFSGIGGQGVLTVCKLTSYGALLGRGHAVMTQSYGTEMRGGASSGYAVLSSDPIKSPVIENDADFGVVMHPKALASTIEGMRPHGTLLFESTMMDPVHIHFGGRLVGIPAVEIAEEMGQRRATNMVFLGALAALNDFGMADHYRTAAQEKSPAKNEDALQIILRAFDRGFTTAQRGR